jgi:hypothetical protein
MDNIELEAMIEQLSQTSRENRAQLAALSKAIHDLREAFEQLELTVQHANRAWLDADLDRFLLDIPWYSRVIGELQLLSQRFWCPFTPKIDALDLRESPFHFTPPRGSAPLNIWGEVRGRTQDFVVKDCWFSDSGAGVHIEHKDD